MLKGISYVLVSIAAISFFSGAALGACLWLETRKDFSWVRRLLMFAVSLAFLIIAIYFVIILFRI